MKINVVFDFAKVYDVSRIDVVKGQKFSLEADQDGKIFSDNDPVLDLKQSGLITDIVAAEVGTSILWMVGADKQILKELTISVVDKLDPLATKLNLSAK